MRAKSGFFDEFAASGGADVAEGVFVGIFGKWLQFSEVFGLLVTKSLISLMNLVK